MNAAAGTARNGERAPEPSVKLTLRALLALWAALATGVAVLLVAAGLYFSVNDLLRRAQEDRLQGSVTALQTRLEDALRR